MGTVTVSDFIPLINNGSFHNRIVELNYILSKVWLQSCRCYDMHWSRSGRCGGRSKLRGWPCRDGSVDLLQQLKSICERLTNLPVTVDNVSEGLARYLPGSVLVRAGVRQPPGGVWNETWDKAYISVDNWKSTVEA